MGLPFSIRLCSGFRLQKEEALLVCARKRGSFQVECSMVLVLIKENGEDYIA
jgi:hypothetical protein